MGMSLETPVADPHVADGRAHCRGPMLDVVPFEVAPGARQY